MGERPPLTASDAASPGQAGQEFHDLHGREVHAFSMEMANVGFHRMAELLLSMLRSEAWRSFGDGLGSYNFLPGEFDYFLSQRGIRRGDVMKLPDVEVKAELEAAMDERRTGEDGYRRPALRVRAENPEVPGRPIEPFGYTQAEAKALADDSAVLHGTRHQEPLGVSVRWFTNSGGQTTRPPARTLPMVERLRRSAMRLDNADLDLLMDALEQERRRRSR
jgi:hypothetical protein